MAGTSSITEQLGFREQLIVAQAVYQHGNDAWPVVAKLLTHHPLISRPKDFFSAETCRSIYLDLMNQANLDLTTPGVAETAKTSSAKIHLRLAQKHYALRVKELRELILAEEAKFHALAKEIDEIRSGAWDEKIAQELRGSGGTADKLGDGDTGARVSPSHASSSSLSTPFVVDVESTQALSTANENPDLSDEGIKIQNAHVTPAVPDENLKISDAMDVDATVTSPRRSGDANLSVGLSKRTASPPPVSPRRRGAPVEEEKLIPGTSSRQDQPLSIEPATQEPRPASEALASKFILPEAARVLDAIPWRTTDSRQRRIIKEKKALDEYNKRLEQSQSQTVLPPASVPAPPPPAPPTAPTNPSRGRRNRTRTLDSTSTIPERPKAPPTSGTEDTEPLPSPEKKMETGAQAPSDIPKEVVTTVATKSPTDRILHATPGAEPSIRVTSPLPEVTPAEEDVNINAANDLQTNSEDPAEPLTLDQPLSVQDMTETIETSGQPIAAPEASASPSDDLSDAPSEVIPPGHPPPEDMNLDGGDLPVPDGTRKAENEGPQVEEEATVEAELIADTEPPLAEEPTSISSPQLVQTSKPAEPGLDEIDRLPEPIEPSLPYVSPSANISTPPADISTPPADISTLPADISTPPADISTPLADISTPLADPALNPEASQEQVDSDRMDLDGPEAARGQPEINSLDTPASDSTLEKLRNDILVEAPTLSPDHTPASLPAETPVSQAADTPASLPVATPSASNVTETPTPLDVIVPAVAAARGNRSKASRKSVAKGKRKAAEVEGLAESGRDKKRPRDDSEPMEEEVSTSVQKKKQVPMAIKRFQNVIGMLHNQISQHRNGNIFHNPIKPADAPDYHDIVKRPIDLKTIKARVKDGTISDSNQYQRDIYLMFANSLMYNRPGSDIYKMAEEMMIESDQLIMKHQETEVWSGGA